MSIRLPIWLADLMRGGYRNPTKNWPTLGLVTPVYRVAERRLNGVPLQAAFSELQSFGRATTCHWVGPTVDLIYRPQGLKLGLASDLTLLAVHFVLASGDLDGDLLRIAPTRPRLVPATGDPVDLDPNTSAETLCALLGAPVDEFQSVGQTVTQHVAAGAHFQSCRTADGRLVSLEVGSAG